MRISLDLNKWDRDEKGLISSAGCMYESVTCPVGSTVAVIQLATSRGKYLYLHSYGEL